jgi:putative aldouronate transport system permease protein
MLNRNRNRIRSTPGELVFDAANSLFMLALCIVMLYPFWYILVYAMNETHDARLGGLWFWPRKFTLSNFKYVLMNPLIRNAYLVTIARTVSGSLIHLVVTGFAAYTLSKRYLPGRKLLTYFFVVPMFIGGTIVSGYVVTAKLRLLNNFLVYILPGAFSFFMMAIIRAFIEEVPASIEESAKIDGASYYRIFFQLIVPLCMPIIATVLIFSAVGHWLDFYTNLLYVTKQELYTVQFMLYRIIRYATEADVTGGMAAQWARASLAKEKITTQTLQMTTLIIVTVPILFVYPFFQKYIIKGVLIGSIKG